MLWSRGYRQKRVEGAIFARPMYSNAEKRGSALRKLRSIILVSGLDAAQSPGLAGIPLPMPGQWLREFRGPDAHTGQESAGERVLATSASSSVLRDRVRLGKQTPVA